MLKKVSSFLPIVVLAALLAGCTSSNHYNPYNDNRIMSPTYAPPQNGGPTAPAPNVNLNYSAGREANVTDMKGGAVSVANAPAPSADTSIFAQSPKPEVQKAEKPAAAPQRTYKLGVMEPVSKGRLKSEDIDMLWSMLESSIQSEKYTVITRSALKQMMDEIGLTTSSDLLNMNTNQKAKLGMIEGVKYILVSEVGTLDKRTVCTMRVIDSSTGEVIPFRSATLVLNNLDELADQLEPALEKLFSDGKQLRSSALLTPIVKAANAPANLSDDFTVNMESCLLQAGVQIQNLKSVNKILSDNGISSLEEAEPKTYSKIGKLLEVELLLQPTITKFEVQAFPFVVTETGYKGVNHVGAMDGYLRVISAQTGRVVASIPVELKVYFQNLDRQITMNWTTEDYHKYLLKAAVAEQIIPELFKSLQPRAEQQ